MLWNIVFWVLVSSAGAAVIATVLVLAVLLWGLMKHLLERN